MSVKIDKGSAPGTLSLTPLIDIVFLLLIFFLVATRFAEEERELDLNLPDASEAQPLTSKPHDLFINIDRQGRFYVTGKILDVEQLFKVLKRAYDNNPGRVTAVVRADEDCRWEPVVAAMNLCKKAGIRDVRPATK